MVRLISFVMVILIFSACSHTSPYRQVGLNEIIENKDLSYIARDTSWKIYKKINMQDYVNSHKIPGIDKSLPGTNYEVHIYTYPYHWMPIERLFDKDGKYAEGEHVAFDDDKKKNVKYRVIYTVNVKNLKCVGKVYSQGSGGNIYSAISKNYSITCGYYDKAERENDGRRLLLVDYNYKYANGKTRLKKDIDLKREELLTAEQAEEGLKEAVKELVKTIEIKNFDRERMEKEGLMHYDKAFESTKW